MADIDDLSGRMLGEFVLRERIDEGGFGAVYRCVQPLLGRDAVVKVLHRQLRRRDVALQRFMREAQLASRLDHPYAAHVYAFGVEEDGLLWIAMELVQGTTLDRWLQARGPLPINQLVPFFDRVAEVVHVAHEAGIVHRDLKPSNMMVVERAGQLLPKLLDFGVAKLLDGARAIDAQATAPIPRVDPSDEPSERPGRDAASTRSGSTSSPPSSGPGRPLTHAGARIGSPPYMAPEQWTEPTAVGRAADIYALGIIAYEALAGRRPFVANTADEYAELHLGATAAPLGGDFAPALDRVLGRALAKRPEDRYASALDLAAALRAELRSHLSEQLSFSARQWDDRARPSEMLWRGAALADLERWTRHTSAAAIAEPVVSFIAASRRYARRGVWIRGLVVALAATAAVAGFGYRAALQGRMRAEIAESGITQAEVEQGRQALLHGESADAQLHLGEAYRRGDRSPGVAFMLARAVQPRRAEIARLPSSAGRMWSAAFSPDGRRIVTTDDRAAQLWDADTHQLLSTLPAGDTVYQALFTPDGARVITACGDGTVKIWNAGSGALERELAPAAGRAPRRYSAIAMPAVGGAIAAIDMLGGVVDVWDVRSGEVLAELANEPLEYPSLAFSADGRWLATSGGGDARLYDAHTWKAIAAGGPRVRSVAFSPDGARLVVGTAGGDAAIWDVARGARLHHLREVGEAVDRVAFSPDGALAITASRDGAEQVWRAASGEMQSQFNVLHGKILALEFDPSSRLALAASAGGTIAVVDAATGMPVATLEGPAKITKTAHFDPAARRIVSASWDGTARIWDATSPYRRWSSSMISEDCGVSTSVEPDSRVIAIGCRDHSTLIWDTARDTLLAELPGMAPAPDGFASALPAVSAAGDRAAIARGDLVEVYALPGGRLVRTIAHSAPVSAVAFARAGRDLISGTIGGELRLTRDGAEPATLPGADAGIDVVALLADGRAVSVDADRQLRVYDPSTRAALATLTTATRIAALRSSPDGHRLVTLPSDLGAALPPELWDLDSLQLVTALTGHVGLVFSARFVAGELVTAGGDGTARRWDPSTGQPRAVYRGGAQFLADATIDPTGAMVIAGGGGGVLRFWDLASGRPLWLLQAHKTAVIGLHFDGDDMVTRGLAGDVARWTLPSAARVLGPCGACEMAAAP